VTTVHVLVPEGVDDPARPSGGNRYDRRIIAGLATLGWDVRETVVPGGWPSPDARALSDLRRLLAGMGDGSLVLVDGLIASAAATALPPEAPRLRLVVLVHMPLPDGASTEAEERRVLEASRGVVTTSSWTRDRLLERYGLRPDRVRVALPGADRGTPAPGTPDGGRLLCVAAVIPQKGQHVLLDALALLPDTSWRCTLVGSLDRDPGFVRRLRQQAAASGIADRISLRGPLTGADLRDAYRSSDLLVLPSRFETFGMVVVEALAFGLPVIASSVGGVPEALGGSDSGPPGLLVPPGDASALAEALSGWLGGAELRGDLRQAAAERRTTLPGWDATSAAVAVALRAAEGEPEVPSARSPG
jgi:glycosyltransferase involved in cell wall biosynthesis